jgi:hypothetical protein
VNVREDDDLLADLDQLPRLGAEIVPGGERRHPRAPHRRKASRFARLGPVDHLELDLRVEHIALREVAHGPRVVDAPHELDVLRRLHRPSISAGGRR